MDVSRYFLVFRYIYIFNKFYGMEGVLKNARKLNSKEVPLVHGSMNEQVLRNREHGLN
jgi:hypothetical protein